jgi:glycosyltransferase involved in cell wall biosynthesis
MMPSSSPFRVSVVMAVKNAAAYLAESLDSIAAQTYGVHEVILVDGQSTDDTPAIAARYPGVRMIQESGRGYASAWNDGIRASTGDGIALLDSDDRWVSGKLQWQVDALAADAEADGVVGHVTFFAEPGRALPPSFRPELLGRAHVGYMPGALLARRRLFDRVGLFDPDWVIANDIDWFARLKDHGTRLVVLPQVLLEKRVHDGNVSYVSARTSLINTEMIRALRRSIHRQRQAPQS